MENFTFSAEDLARARAEVSRRGDYPYGCIDKVVGLVACGLGNGDMVISSELEEFGCMGVACRIGNTAFYFCDGDYQNLPDYLDGRNEVDVLADIAEGVLLLLCDEFTEDEGNYVLCCLRESCAG